MWRLVWSTWKELMNKRQKTTGWRRGKKCSIFPKCGGRKIIKNAILTRTNPQAAQFASNRFMISKVIDHFNKHYHLTVFILEIISLTKVVAVRNVRWFGHTNRGTFWRLVELHRICTVDQSRVVVRWVDGRDPASPHLFYAITAAPCGHTKQENLWMKYKLLCSGQSNHERPLQARPMQISAITVVSSTAYHQSYISLPIPLPTHLTAIKIDQGVCFWSSRKALLSTHIKCLASDRKSSTSSCDWSV